MAVSMSEERQYAGLERTPERLLVCADEKKRLVRIFESFIATDAGFDAWFKIASNRWHVTIVERCKYADSWGAVIYCAEGFRFYPLSGKIPELTEREVETLTFSLDTDDAYELAAASGVDLQTIPELIQHEAMIR